MADTVCPECGKRQSHLAVGECCSACDYRVPVVAVVVADRHLDAAAKALDRDFELWPSPHYLPNSPKQPLGRDMLRQVSDTAVTAYLDSLLGDLPEEAVEALAQEFWQRDMDGNAYEVNLTWAKAKGDHDEYRAEASETLEAFLTSLRDSLASETS